jgi:hypothetical protein
MPWIGVITKHNATLFRPYKHEVESSLPLPKDRPYGTVFDTKVVLKEIGWDDFKFWDFPRGEMFTQKHDNAYMELFL